MSENERTLNAGGKRAQLLIDAVPNGILGVDQAGLITLANCPATRLFGYEHAELMGQAVENLLLKAGSDHFGRRKDGSEFPVEIGLTPMESDGVACVLYSIVDLTDRKRAEQALIDNATRMAAVMNTVVDGLMTIDESGTIQSFNRAAERIFGYTAAEVVGQNVRFVMAEPQHGAHDGPPPNFMETVIKSVMGVGREVGAKRKDGCVFPMDLAVGEMLLHDRRLYVGTLRDITVRKEVETERLNLIASLKQSNQELDDFAYIASHDLKEPLRGLFNNAQFLREDLDGLVDETAQKRFERIFFLCKRMERLIDDLLYFSQLGRQHLAYRKTDLNVVVRDILEQLESVASQPGVTVSLKEPLPVMVCDATRVGEVFRNLIINAVKYNDKLEKLVEIGYLSEQGSHRNVLYVRDNGIGIPAQFRQEVFTIFKRLLPEDDKVRGSGVGLTFAKKIVERHGGHLWLESEAGQGTTFFFTLKEGIAK